MTDTQLNGISLYTNQGAPRTRYNLKDRVALCGGTMREFQRFVELFCPGRPLYARTRHGSDDPRAWTTPGTNGKAARIADDEIAKHLVGNCTPGIKPCWVAPRSWEFTKWAGIDIDFRGDTEDFRRRCAFVRQTLQSVGVSRKHILTSITPSGGRHFRIFFDSKVRVVDIEYVFSKIGLRETPGKIEIFPRMNKGMRLPFGYIPGRQHDPSKWVRFIRKIILRTWPLVKFKRMDKLAIAAYQESERKGLNYDPTSIEVKPTRVNRISASTKPLMYGVPFAVKQSSEKHQQSMSTFKELMSRPFSSPSDARLLWQIGILCPGTRTLCTQRLAWNLIHVRKLPPEIAADQLVEWVYVTGANTSTDVMKDNASGTRNVEKQVRSCVNWVASQSSEGGSFSLDLTTFSPDEVRAIKKVLGKERSDRMRLLSTALRLLRFAKLHGKETEGGWEVILGINGVVRKWPECRGNNYYKPVIDELIKCGLMTLVAEKKQTQNKSGRPRTYRVNVSPKLRFSAHLTHEQVLGHITKQKRNAVEKALTAVESSDTYRMFQHSPSMQLMGTKLVVGQEGNDLHSDSDQSTAESTKKEEASRNQSERLSAAIGRLSNPCCTKPHSMPRQEKAAFADGGQPNLSLNQESSDEFSNLLIYRRMRTSGFKGSYSDLTCNSTSEPTNEFKYDVSFERQPTEGQAASLGQSRRIGRGFRPPPFTGSRIEDEDYSLPKATLRRRSHLYGDILE